MTPRLLDRVIAFSFASSEDWANAVAATAKVNITAKICFMALLYLLRKLQ